VPAAVSWLGNDPGWSEFSDSSDGASADVAGHPGGSTTAVRSTAVSAAAVHVPEQSHSKLVLHCVRIDAHNTHLIS